ncbi:methyltransferase domain-containing protein [Altererythrobacter aurantiacus]|uniref:Methyltransferase domain-containing protein n=1 Tax=Parapontixanthobacter aurantiacus TaxID=1463599 RepID=A0A844Z9N8_9SPHN|nr:class I SAM-dependent methyltransferase [Parapontixanthobacter aurantiacus]MXO84635.1 methyltransferase domain-containing protein [Parapontixanthobacter aurantiacus]
MAQPDESQAWDDFWQQNAGGKGQGGCLPEGDDALDRVQKEVWSRFARTLRKGARLLDLATGDGRVMRWLVAARRDVKPVGCDRAPELPEAPRGTKMRAGVSLEDLPFRDGQFAAVTSQFGFEYAEPQTAARELARVLANDGVAALLTHRQDGAILEHNLARREAIRWALEERAAVEVGKRHLGLRSVGIGGAPATLSDIAQEGAKQFGPRSPAWEIPEAVRQTLTLGARDHPANVGAMLNTIAAKARNELARIASLEAACARTANAEAFEGALAEAGLTQLSIEELCVRSEDKLFGDFRILRHA